MALRWDVRAARARGRRGMGTAVDNLALVPASLLPHKPTYQRLANQLPSGTVLVVLPADEGTEQQTLHASAAHLRAKGHPVVTLAVDDILTLAAGRPVRPALFTPPARAAGVIHASAITRHGPRRRGAATRAGPRPAGDGHDPILYA